MEKSEKVDAYIAKQGNHREVLQKLRGILAKYPCTETLKWGMPTYVYQGRNLIGIGAFKKYVGLWFFQGALLRDDHKLLHNAQEGKTKAMRQVHFFEAKDVDETVMKLYIEETLENQERGMKIDSDRTKKNIRVPVELERALARKELKGSFEGLTEGRKREYAEYIASAKKEQTKMNRLTRILPLIENGKGLNDQYKR